MSRPFRSVTAADVGGATRGSDSTHARARTHTHTHIVLPRDSRAHHNHSAASLSSKHPKSCRLPRRTDWLSLTGSLESLLSPRGVGMAGGRRGLVAPQNTFLENIVRRSNGKTASLLHTTCEGYYCISPSLRVHSHLTEYWESDNQGIQLLSSACGNKIRCMVLFQAASYPVLKMYKSFQPEAMH